MQIHLQLPFSIHKQASSPAADYSLLYQLLRPIICVRMSYHMVTLRTRPLPCPPRPPRPVPLPRPPRPLPPILIISSVHIHKFTSIKRSYFCINNTHRVTYLLYYHPPFCHPKVLKYLSRDLMILLTCRLSLSVNVENFKVSHYVHIFHVFYSIFA